MKNSLRHLFGITGIIGVHLGVRIHLKQLDDRLDVVGALAVALACAYWLAITRVPAKTVFFFPVLVATLSATAFTAERFLSEYGTGYISLQTSIYIFVLSVAMGAIAGAGGLLTKAAIAYGNPTAPKVNQPRRFERMRHGPAESAPDN